MKEESKVKSKSQAESKTAKPSARIIDDLTEFEIQPDEDKKDENDVTGKKVKGESLKMTTIDQKHHSPLGISNKIEIKGINMRILTQKYLKVSDFLEQQLKFYMTTEDKTAAFKAFALSAGNMMELMDAERVGVLLLENDLFDLFLDAFLGQVRNGAGHKTGMIVATTFIASIKLKKLPISL